MWQKAVFPFPRGSAVGRAANQAYLPSSSEARWKKVPSGIAFAWSGDGEAVGIIVVLDETQEVSKYVLRASGSLRDLLYEWEPAEEIAKKWYEKVQSYFSGKPWDGKTASEIVR